MKGYPKESAASRATYAVIVASPEETLGEVEVRIRQNVNSLEMLHYVYVLDGDGKLVGILSMRNILSNPSDVTVADVMSEALASVLPETDQEAAAIKAVEKKIRAMPVLERDGTFLGVITSDSILDILSEEHSEDLLHIGGVQKNYSASSILKERLVTLLLARLPWLLVGLGGGLLAAMAVESFENIITEYIVLAFFLPLVVYMSDAVAGQTLTILIRAMALDRTFSVKRYILRELGLGLSIATVVGLILGVVSLMWFSEPVISFILAIALFFSVLVAVSVALFMTLILKFFKRDPAVGSGPFATIIIDIITIFIYFSVASFFLNVI